MASGSTQILGPRLKVTTPDQTVSTYPIVLQFSNGSVTVSGSTAIITTGGSGGGAPVSGSSNYIQISNTLQVGATAYVSSFTVDGNAYFSSMVVIQGTRLLPYANGFDNATTAFMIVQQSSPVLIIANNGWIGMNSYPNFPLTIISSAPTVPNLSDTAGALFRFTTNKNINGTSTTGDYSGLKVVQSFDRTNGFSNTFNGNVSVITASGTKTANGTGASTQFNLDWRAFDGSLTDSNGSGASDANWVLFNGSAKHDVADNTGISNFYGLKIKQSFTDGVFNAFTTGSFGTYIDLTDNESASIQPTVSHLVYGHYVNAATSQNGDAFGYYINAVSGVHSYGFYNNANVPSYFGGKVGISTNTPVVKLEVYNSSIASLGTNAGFYASTTTNLQVNIPFFAASLGTSAIKGAIDFDTPTVRVRLDISNTGNFGSSYTLRVGTQTPGGAYHVAITTNGAFSLAGGSPTVSSCGTTPNGALVRGSNQVGEISIGGTAALACTLTFAPPFNFTPVCTVSDNNAAVAVAVNSVSNSAVTFGFGASLVGGRVYYQCLGNNE